MAEHEEHGEEHGEGGGSHKGGGGHGGGHGGGGHAEHGEEGVPEWMVSFADNVCLLMGFFVILLAMNMGPKGGNAGSDSATGANSKSEREADFVIGVRQAFNNPIDMASDNPAEAWLRKRMKEQASGKASEDGVEGNENSVGAIRPPDYKNVTFTVPFADGTTTVPDSQRSKLVSAVDKLRDQKWIIEVQGHCSPHEARRNPRAAYELSYERAFAVAQIMVEAGMKWQNIRVVAAGDNDRLVPRTFDVDQDRTNQRVELVVTNFTVNADPYKRPKDEGSKNEHPSKEDASPSEIELQESNAADGEHR